MYHKKQAFVLDVREDLGVFLETPQLYIPPKKDGRGRKPSAYTCAQKPVSLKFLIKQIDEKDWQTITHQEGTKGRMIRKTIIIDDHIWKPEKGNQIESVQLIISTETNGSEIKYSLYYCPEGKIDLFRQMQRYWVERAFQNVKSDRRSGTIKIHQYQVRS